VLQCVSAIRTRHDDLVVSGAIRAVKFERIIVDATSEECGVDTAAPIDIVVARPAGDEIVAVLALQRIVARGAVQIEITLLGALDWLCHFFPLEGYWTESVDDEQFGIRE
jgi:hypothetical protein